MARAKHWCFTLNNPQEWPIDFTTWSGVSYAVHQREHGSTGTPHLQGYVEFAQRQRLTQVRRLLRGAHWETRQGPRENAREYCMKEEGRLEGPWEYGEFSSQTQGRRTDLLQVKTLLDTGAKESEVASEHFEVWCRYYRAFREYRRLTVPNRDWKSTVHVLYGPTGTGKSRWAAEQFPGAYWKQRSNWWDGYEGQEVVCIDEFYGWLPFDVMLRLLDRYPLLVETKGGQTSFQAKTIIITTNQKPHKWYKNGNWEALKRRVDVWHYLPMEGVHEEGTNYDSLILGGWEPLL
uniref:Replication-associated protein n=1 Tax=Red panda feces-associated circular DNA virus 7 TaxID=2863982 RepID=A0A8K1M4K8_9VIRU|nr:replication-associated protein [Red panda feces-associated circular DNA virus 7]